jgi:hypothetical protein
MDIAYQIVHLSYELSKIVSYSTYINSQYINLYESCDHTYVLPNESEVLIAFVRFLLVGLG